MMFKRLYEELTRKDLLDFQSFLIQHLPSYVDVELKSADTIELKGEFDPIELALYDIGTGSARIVVTGDYSQQMTLQCGESWRPAELKPNDLRPILMALNTAVGRAKALRWLKSEGFNQKSPIRDDRDMPIVFEFTKLYDDVDKQFQILVSFNSALEHAYTQAGYFNTHNEKGNFWQNSRHGFEFITLKRLQHAVEQAVDEFESSGDKHKELNALDYQIGHLELKKHE